MNFLREFGPVLWPLLIVTFVLAWAFLSTGGRGAQPTYRDLDGLGHGR